MSPSRHNNISNETIYEYKLHDRWSNDSFHSCTSVNRLFGGRGLCQRHTKARPSHAHFLKCYDVINFFFTYFLRLKNIDLHNNWTQACFIKNNYRCINKYYFCGRDVTEQTPPLLTSRRRCFSRSLSLSVSVQCRSVISLSRALRL